MRKVLMWLPSQGCSSLCLRVPSNSREAKASSTKFRPSRSSGRRHCNSIGTFNPRGVRDTADVADHTEMEWDTCPLNDFQDVPVADGARSEEFDGSFSVRPSVVPAKWAFEVSRAAGSL